MNIAFVQLGSWGDNINSTLMFRPIKNAFPDSNLEVHTTDLYASAFANNPLISRLVTYPANSKSECFNLYNTVPQQVRQHRFDKVFVPAPILHQDLTSRKHPEFGHNIICTLMRVLEDEGIDYDFPVKTILRLTHDEVSGVDTWLAANNVQLKDCRNILMEVHGESGQTFWDKHWTLAVGRHLLRNRRVNLFISRRDKTQEILQLEREFRPHFNGFGARWVGGLTIRQCAELYNRCDTFMSVSSGLSNACNTDYCRTDLKWIETVNSSSVTSAPVRSDGKTFWYDNNLDQFLRMLVEHGL